MAVARSRRLRLLESLRKTISEILHESLFRRAQGRCEAPPQNTSAIYISASNTSPELLEQLLCVHTRVRQEKGEDVPQTPPDQQDDFERKAMLSAIRAAVAQSQARFGA